MIYLFKLYIITIFKNSMSIFISLLILLFLTISLGTSMLEAYISMNHINSDIISSEQQDFYFSFLNKVDIDYLSNEFDITIQKESSKFLESNSNYYRVVKENSEINFSYITEGRNIEKSGEVLLDSNSRYNEQYFLNDNITIENTTYEIVGFFVQPNILQPNMSKDFYNPYQENDEDFLIKMIEYDFNLIDSAEHITYTGKWNNVENNDLFEEFDAKLNSDNPEVFGITTISNILFVIALITLCLLGSIIIVLVHSVISNTITRLQTQFGVLIAGGIKKWKIIFASTCIGLICFFVVIIALLISNILGKYIFNLLTFNYIIPKYYIPLTNSTILNVSVIIIVVICLYTCLFVGFKLSANTITLIKRIGRTHNFKLNRLYLKLLSRGNNFNSIISRKLTFSKFVTIILLVFCTFTIIVQSMIALTIYQFPDNLLNNFNEYTLYDYQNAHNTSTTIYNDLNSQKYTAYNSDLFDIEVLYDSNFNGFNYDINDLKNGLIINKVLSEKYGLSQGDQLELNIGGDEVNISISKVSELLIGKTAYTSYDYFSTLNVESPASSTGTYSNEIDSDSLFVSSSLDTSNYIKKSMEAIKVISIFIFIYGLLISIVLLYIVANLVIKNIEKNIEKFNIMGYSKDRIYRLTMKKHLYLTSIGYIISIPYFIIIIYIMSYTFSNNSNIYYNFEISYLTSLILFVLINIIYFSILKIRLNKIFMLYSS